MTSRNTRSGQESGFALIVALLALMLLTFLGLTLSATTSTELQIANNYRYSQQALYNAEAGLEAARVVLRTQGDGQLVLPVARFPPGVAPWTPTGTGWTANPANRPTARFTHPPTNRNWEGWECDQYGNSAGFGEVLVDPNNAAVPFENVSTVFGQNLNGGVTVWVRRELVFQGGTVSDNPAGENVVVTSEGSAPYTGAGTAFQAANRAIRRLESHVKVSEGCRRNKTQAGGFQSCLS